MASLISYKSRWRGWCAPAWRGWSGCGRLRISLHNLQVGDLLVYILSSVLSVTRSVVPVILVGLWPALPVSEATMPSAAAEGLLAKGVDSTHDTRHKVPTSSPIPHAVMFPAAGVLVLLLYLLLFHDIFSQLFSSKKSGKSNQSSSNVVYR